MTLGRTRRLWNRLTHNGATLLCLVSCASPALAGDNCPDATEARQAFYGDLHIHTGVSADAAIFGTTNRPADAYQFARGETIPIRQQLGSGPATPAQLARPLDFAAVTEHAENLGAVSLCQNPDSPLYDRAECQRVRAPNRADDMAMMSQDIGEKFHAMYSESLCGPGGERCNPAAIEPWKEIQRAAAQFDAPCEFTTFVGYEYSPTPGGAKVHHNVIFRGEDVIPLPIAWNEAPSVYGMWERLDAECAGAGTGCEVITIPHNSNLSNGRMFRLDYDGESDPKEQARLARLRARIETVTEMFQFKGQSECRNGLWNVLGATDEFCEYEDYRGWGGHAPASCVGDEIGVGALQNQGCVSRQDFVRTALASGIAEQQRIGVNPFKFGFIGSTDAHDGTAGDTDEWVHDEIARPAKRFEQGRDSSGGLAGVWAEENTRAAIFDAMRRRETFATSGPRMQVRFFGGWALPSDLCSAPDLASRGYAQGVPMGGDLAPRPESASPRFVVSAVADPGTTKHPGGLLQRAQIVKVWPGPGDELHQKVVDVAGGPNTASVDLATCTPSGSGATTLCGVWQDPDFDPAQGAAYYARVLENPSCRNTGWACANAGPEDRPAFCARDDVAKRGQERAWTAPIWFTP